jgi:Protein of unknown function (DUF1501)
LFSPFETIQISSFFDQYSVLMNHSNLTFSRRHFFKTGSTGVGVAALANLLGSEHRTSAALVKDLKRLGMLDDTLVIWGGEFGRTSYTQGVLTSDIHGRDAATQEAFIDHFRILMQAETAP